MLNYYVEANNYIIYFLLTFKKNTYFHFNINIFSAIFFTYFNNNKNCCMHVETIIDVQNVLAKQFLVFFCLLRN